MAEISRRALDQQPTTRFLSAADINSSREPIAIIGMGCRFPGAKGPEDFWRLLCDEVDAITEVPADRFPIDALYDSRPGIVGKMVTRWGGFLDGVDQFDALFFGISPHAANRMDPQYRILLEVAWEALEDAGLTREQLVGSKTGVFIGMTTGDYQDLQCRNTDEIDVYVVTGGLRSVASGRISYAFDLQGPSIVVDTACTSSLTALHLACQSLRTGECSMALVGGSHLILQPELTLGFSAAGMMSPDGHCKFGDANANGYVRSEGVGVLVLKPLGQALADGDPIQALIRGSATNNDGRSGKSLVTPGYNAQVAVLREAYRDANVLPSQVHYVEAHGTGTSVGDSVEIQALATVLAEGRALDHPCHIGSVKTNIGHTEGAAGMASLVKAVLCLKHRALPKSLHCENLNSVLPWSEVPLVIQQTFEPLAIQDEPILVGVSAFGVSGTNAHIVLEEAKQPASDVTKNDASDRAFLFPLSAHTSEALTALARSYQAFASEYALADVCYTAGVRRTHHAHRLALVVHSYDELHAQLENFLQGRADPNVAFGSVRSDLPQQCFDQLDQIETALPSLRHGDDEHTTLLRSLALLYTLGCPILWSKLYSADSRCVSLPSYPWQHEHFWMKTDARGASNWPPVGERQRGVSSHPLLGHHWTSAVHGTTHFWDMLLSTDLFPYLNDHQVQEVVVLPAAAYAEIVLAATKEVFHIVPVLKDITFKKAIFLSDMKEKHVQLVLTLERPGVATFQFFSQEDSDGTGQTTWTFHASGMAITDLSAMQLGAFKCETPEQIRARCQQVYTGQKYYQSLALRGFRYGPCFQTIAEIARRDGEALGRIQLAEQVAADSGMYLVHPALLDGCFQAILAALPANMSETATYVPVRLKSLQISDRLGQRLWSHAVLREVRDDKTDIIEGDVFLIDEQGRVASASLELIETRIADAREENHLRDWLYEWRWEARPWTQIDRSSQKLPHGPWLIFADSLGISEQLSRLLTVSGRDCVLAFKGTSYQQLTPQRYLLQPSSSQDFQQLLRDASSASEHFCGIIHLWSIDSHPATVKTSASIEAAQQTGVLSVMHLVQAIAGFGGDRPPLLWLVTCGAQPVNQANDVLSVEQAPVSGLGRVLVNEHPELQCRRIDLERADVSTQAQLLFWELQVGDREDEVALSREARLVHRLVRCETTVVENKQSLFRPDASYLVAGGLGGLGLTVADWMVRQGARYLVLVGRSGASLEADREITTLQEMGAQVVIAKADISEEQQVVDLLATIQTSLPPLRGLIHAAAVLDDGVLLHLDAQRFRKVLAPKIDGAWNLHTLTAHLDLDFFVLFSSAATLLGLPGQGNYVAANEFLDVLAHYRRRLGLPGLSINWGAWSEVGLAARSHSSEQLALRGMSSIAPQQGLDALAYLLSQDRPQVAVMPVDWPQWHLFYPEFADSPVLTHLMAQSRTMTHAIVQAAQETLQAPILTTQPEERLELVTRYLDEQINQALGLAAEDSNRDLPLIEQGLDSLMAVELKNKIQAGLGVSVTVTKLLQSASTVQLAQDIFEQLQTAFTHQLTDKIGKNNEQSKLIQDDPKFIFTQIPSLVVKERTEPIPLSFAQSRLWFLDKMFPGSTNYNVPVIVRLTGTLNIQALQQSLQEIIRRHEALRTTFDTVNGQPIQVISSDASLSLPLVDLCACRLEEREQTATRLATEEAQERPFDLERGPLFRAQLLHLSPSQYSLLITVHHIVFDAWSFGVLLRELSVLYTANVQGQPSPLADLPIQYGDYTFWQHEQIQGELLNDQLAYWKERLAGAPLVLELPTDHPRPAVESYRGTRFFFRFSPSLMEGVVDLSRREGVTLFMTMLAAWQIVLGHTSQQDDFLVGSPIAGRQRIEMEKLIGFLVNTLVLRVQLAGHLTFRELLKQVKETTLAAYEHQDVPFERLVEVLHPQRDLSRSPVFQVMFILQNMTLPPLELPGLSATASEGPCTTSRFDLFINLWEKADFDHWIEYPTDLFEEGTIARIVEHCQRVLEQVVTNADQPIASISLLTEHEKHQVLNEWNRPINHYPVNQCIHQLFMQQAQRTPDAVAAFYGDQHINYSELDRRSNQLALFLQALEVGLEARVGVYMERSLEVLIGLLGVLKAGGAFVPLDTSSPGDRLAFMIHDAQIVVLIIQECQRVVLPPLSLPVISIDSDWSSIDTTYPQTLIQNTTPENLAYIIYTSGSTGRPKGVMGTHGAILNRFAWMWHTYPFEQNEVCCQKTSLNFVDSIWEIFGPLIKGRPIVVIAEDVVKDLALFVARLAEHNVTRLVLVPSLLQAMLEVYPDLGERLPALQLWTCSGEALSGDLFSQFTHSLKGRRLLNLYGSSEVAADVTWHMATDDLTDSSWVPIGRPIDNIHTYILDAHLQLVPPGGVGTLYIGGVGQARGYLHLPDLTAERFVPHPFVGKGLAPFQLSERLYRTGDLARYRADGVLEYLGRIDQQVKIRGFRIELGEIEAVLHTHPGVRDAVIATYEDDPTNKKLVAYVLLKDSTLATEQLQDWLRKKVPEYMIPHVFMYLNAFPLTANGKLDRRSLPRPTPQYLEKQRTFVPPRTETEHQLTKIFADLLSLETIGIEDNIFDLGFHSLLVTRTAARIRETLQVDVSPPLFFEHWTIGRLAQYLQTTYGPAPTPRSTAVSTEIMTHQITPEAVTTDRVSPIKVSPIPPRQHSRVNHSLTHMSEQKGPTTASSIAIIGMSGVFPQAPDVQRLWNNLLMGRDCISEIPPSRWDWQTYFGHPAASNPNKTNVKWAGAVEDVETFDPQFFGISPREAELMDPQQRLLMMYVWKAIEDAGYSAESLSGTDTALFMGTASTGYSERSFKAGMVIDGYSATGLAPSMGPNRMSYFLNLHGPSEAIETACSSSLVAIHRGVSAIESGQCTMAIVGGVNTIVSPEVHISMSKAGMLSEDGRCKTFSAQADGYVRSEGVGMLVLKKLSDAEQAGDHIYGVIRGSAENHGGRTSSLTAPNPRAQADLLIAAYRKAGIDPRTVSYIEAHGTGTPLGDPIEITGLKAAFGELAQIMEEEPWPVATCGIGSVKSNIGHLELAAGVTGVIKVLLQMQHKKLVKSLHCERLNPYIELEGSPFYIVQETREWEAQRDQMGNVLPRRAGVSSFGFGGVNAHVVLEEYVPKPRPPHPQSLPQPPALIVLSARNEERLHEQVRQLLAWIVGGTCQGCGRPQGSAERPSPPACACPMGTEEPPELLDLAYTLQVGREPMEERLALQVGSLAELSEKLRTYLQSQQEGRDWYRGQTRRYRDIVALFDTDDELQETIDKWLQKGKYEKLQQGWVKGLKIEWRHLYGEHLPCRISLPTYPFARERYWIPIGANPLATATSSTTTYGTNSPEGPRIQTPTLVALHPLVQRNTSTLWEQQFSSTFHGDEFFLADHVIKGQRIMPAVAYLEMARAAVREAIGDDETPEPSQIRLSNVVWIRPLIISSHPVTVRIALEALESEAISFVIRSERQGEEAEEHIYCQGRALVEQAHERQAPIQSLDLATLQSRCQRQVPASECYQRYHELGITYGPAMRAIEQLSVGEGMVLARLRLPVGVVPCADPGLVPGEAQTRMEEAHGDGPYVLHPSMLDAALQACLGLAIGQPGMQELSLPFALSDLAIMDEVEASGWAWIVRRQGSTGESVLDIEVCDDEGRVAVHIGGLSTRSLLAGSLESLRTVLLTPDWKEETLVSSHLSEEGAILPPSLIVLCDLPESLASRIQAEFVLDGHCRSLSVGKQTGASPVPTTPFQQLRRELRFQDAMLQLIQELQRLWDKPNGSSRPTYGGKETGVSSVPTVPILVQVVVAHREEPSFFEALIGVLKTAQQEYPRLRGQLIEVEGEPEEGELLAWLRENQYRPQEPHIRYRDSKRWVREWQEWPVQSTPARMPWKEGGCYLITGGAGGLARLFVQEIARQVEAATIILVGRSALDASQRAQIVDCGRVQAPTLQVPQAETSGIHIDYQQVDVSDGPAVHALIQRILQKSGHLDGIIHAAGVLRDSLLLGKTPEDAQAVLAPKVVGVEHLDDASREIPLDFFVLCSSLSAVVGNVGQADYASANAYLDAFAHARAAQVRAGERQGATVSINWPLWKEGGMHIEAETIQMMREQAGIEVMETETGMKMLYQALACGQAQVLVVHGQIERIKQRVLGQARDLPAGVGQAQAGRDKRWGQAPSLQVPMDRLHEALTRMVSDLLKVQVEQIDAETGLTEYGFDSITFTEFANHLNLTYQLDLAPPLFFEYSTIESLAHYLQTTHAAALAPHFALVSPAAPEFALGGTYKEFISDKGPSIGASPMTTVPRQRSRVARSLVQVSEQQAYTGAEPIAIIGMSGAFPQADDVQSFWRNLLEGHDCISEIPPSRWDWQSYFGNPATEVNKTNIKWAGVMAGVETFDPLFFGISKAEAEQMDPQQRLLMIYVWKAIEDAGYAPSSLSGTNTALFVGVASSGYSERLSQAGMPIEGYSSTGLVPSVGPNRMSYFLNLHGPSEPIETACSSSLVALHRGVNAIESGQCSMAIVGGINILVSPSVHIGLSKAGMLCEDGRCKSFSAQANGYARGEGVGILVLKKLSQAERTEDHIYGVIRGSAENHGGRASSLTAPNPRAQADLLITAYRKAGVNPRTVGYIEAQGTGTALGDPIEINGLKSAFEELMTRGGDHKGGEEAWCGIGTVKSNIGHLEVASGVVGVIKVLLQMQYQTLVKSLHCDQINPHIQLKGSPFYIVQENRKWEALRDRAGNPMPRRAGVSAFGFGGVNAHVILEEYVPKPQAMRTEGGALSGAMGQNRRLPIVLSARNEERLQEQVKQLLAWVQTGAWIGISPLQDRSEALSLQDLAYTLQVGREAMEERLAMLIGSFAELEEKLSRYLQDPQQGRDWYRGQVRLHKEMVTLLSADEELQGAMQEAIGKWLQHGKYEKLLEWWVKGFTVDWKSLYTVETGSAQDRAIGASPMVMPRRISLPTYPFARERYWVETSEQWTLAGARSPYNGHSQQEHMQARAFYAGSLGHEKGVALRNELEQRIAEIWQHLLGVETVGVFDNFFDLGGHSLFASRLLTQIYQEFGIELPLNILFEAASVSELAQTIERVRQEGISSLSTKSTTIDLREEAKLDPAITPTSISLARATVPRTILLTGATGFLGAFLLYELLHQTSANIYCLVRLGEQECGESRQGQAAVPPSLPAAPASEEAFQKLETHLRDFGLWDEDQRSRIYPLVGDLALPQFGLCWEDFHRLSEQIDTIYHAGAWVNFTYPYSILKTANVLGTEEVLRLACLERLKPVHFISTTAVFSSPQYDPAHIILEDDLLHYCEGLPTGYIESKWVAERLVIEARSRGIPVSIYRPPTVTGDSRTGVFNANDFVLRMLKRCIELQQAPDIHLPMYMAPVDYVSKAIVLLSQQSQLLGKAFNLIPSQPTDLQTLWDIARSCGYPMQMVSLADWYASLQNMALKSQETNFTPFLPLIQQQRVVTPPMLDSSNTIMGLKNTSLAFPPIDRELFGVYFDYFCESGFLARSANLP